MDSSRIVHVIEHMGRLDAWAAAVVPIPLGLWHSVDPNDVHHRHGYVTPGDRGFGRVVMYCAPLIVAQTHALDAFWFEDYLCTIETHLTLHGEGALAGEAEVIAELGRRAPDSMAIASLVEAGARAGAVHQF